MTGEHPANKTSGTDAPSLDEQLSAHVTQARVGSTASGLRVDQAATIYHALTSARTTEILFGPAGSGNTRTQADAARA